MDEYEKVRKTIFIVFGQSEYTCHKKMQIEKIRNTDVKNRMIKSRHKLLR